jgi:predicted TIM-barrel fold metal-dependent hydrolase
MISRRKFLIGAAGATMTSIVGTASGLARGSRPVAPIRFSVPKGACDCQTHVFGDPLRFPFSSGRSYTPEPATISELQALHRALHIDRVVIVQPTVYGTDNACLLDALRRFGSQARGVAMIDAGATQANLDEMERQGVCGIRIGFESSGKIDPAVALQRLQTALRQIAGRKWHIQIGTRLPAIEALQNKLAEVPVPIVFEHFAHAVAPLGLDQAGFKPLLNLVTLGKAYVKITAAYRCCSIPVTNNSTQETDFPEIAPFARALLSANPERVVWGSDWPHSEGTRAGHSSTDVSSPMAVDDGHMLNLLAIWAPDVELRRKILVENPRRLYGF